MWKCVCGEVNQEPYNRCAGCGRTRSGSMFFEERPAATPKQSGDTQNTGSPTDGSALLQGKQRRSLLSRFAFILGILLMVLLPAITILTFVFCRADLITALPLVQNLGIETFIGHAIYIVFGVITALLSLLPGMWTCLFARKAG